jgi:hypothetical protein
MEIYTLHAEWNNGQIQKINTSGKTVAKKKKNTATPLDMHWGI